MALSPDDQALLNDFERQLPYGLRTGQRDLIEDAFERLIKRLSPRPPGPLYIATFTFKRARTAVQATAATAMTSDDGTWVLGAGAPRDLGFTVPGANHAIVRAPARRPKGVIGFLVSTTYMSERFCPWFGGGATLEIYAGFTAAKQAKIVLARKEEPPQLQVYGDGTIIDTGSEIRLSAVRVYE